MREIKFRGLTVKGKAPQKMVEGHFQIIAGKHCIVQSDATVLGSFVYEVEPETVGQFTGLRDRWGNEIWEGDIMKTSNSLPCKVTFGTHLNVVNTRDQGCRGWLLVRMENENYVDPLSLWNTSDLRVIGNIHTPQTPRIL